MMNPPNFIVGNPWCDECKAEHPIGSHLHAMCPECMVRHPESVHRANPPAISMTFTELDSLPSQEMKHLKMWQTALDALPATQDTLTPVVFHNLEPTTFFRWLEGEGVNTLQQKWFCKTTGHFEWRDIPVEKAHAENQG